MGQAFIENALAGQDLTVNGDGSDALDFTYIQDLIQGVIRAAYRTRIEERGFQHHLRWWPHSERISRTSVVRIPWN